MGPEELYERAVAASSSAGVTAWRVKGDLEPDGGLGMPIAPALYAEGTSTVPRVRPDGQRELTVLLDSVASQANRAEAALALAVDAGEVSLPLLEVVFGQGRVQQRVTSLQAPHRCADALWRDSLLDGTSFYATEVGSSVRLASVADATALWRWYPTALLYGWYFSRPEDRRYVKDPELARAITLNSGPRRVAAGPRAWTSRIIGIDPETNIVASSRIDPLQIEAGEVYETPDGRWTTNPEQAEQVPAGRKGDRKAKPYGKKGLASATGHSTVLPTVRPGWVTVGAVEAHGVLQLPLVRRYRFPVDGLPEDAARNAKAALVLLAMAAHELAAQDLVLRSGCGLVATAWHREEVLADGTTRELAFDVEAAVGALRLALDQAKSLGDWHERLALTPSLELEGLVERSLAKVSEPSGNGEA